MHRISSVTLSLLLAAACNLGCVGTSKTKKVDKASLAQFVLANPPAEIPNRLDIDFEGKVKLLGYKVSPTGEAKAGAEITMTLWWKCEKDLPQGWNLFTHVVDAEGQQILNADDRGPLRAWADTQQVLGPGEWEAGKVYVDEMKFTLPSPLETPEVGVYVGIWQGNARLKITAGPQDKDNRAVVARFKTGLAPAAKPAAAALPSLQVQKLNPKEVITIDGKLDEPAWANAARTGQFIDVGSGRPASNSPVQGSARLVWDDTHLYTAFEVQSKDIVGGFPPDAKDPQLWTKDTIEIMLDPDGDGDNLDYYEIQINPQNLVFDTQYDEYNKPKDDSKGQFGHMDWSAKLVSAVQVKGELDKPGKGEGYVVEAKIPWASFNKAKQSPPKLGDQWRMNFYAMKNNGGVAWSPILGKGNFHKASQFGRITWGMPAAAASSASAAPSASAPKLPVPPLTPKPAKTVP